MARPAETTGEVAASGAWQRFEVAAAALGLDIDVQRFPQGTRTAVEAAAAVGCELGQIVKSLVFECDGEPVLALTSGAKRVDTAALGRVLGGFIERADANTVRDATGYAIGGTPPCGHTRPLRTVVDATLLEYDHVWAAAGTPETVFEISSTALVRVASGTVADFAV